MTNNIIEFTEGVEFFRYDSEKKILQVARANGVQKTRLNETVSWSTHPGAASYDNFHGEAFGVDIGKLNGKADLIALLTAVISDLFVGDLFVGEKKDNANLISRLNSIIEDLSNDVETDKTDLIALLTDTLETLSHVYE